MMTSRTILSLVRNNVSQPTKQMVCASAVPPTMLVFLLLESFGLRKIPYHFPLHRLLATAKGKVKGFPLAS